MTLAAAEGPEPSQRLLAPPKPPITVGSRKGMDGLECSLPLALPGRQSRPVEALRAAHSVELTAWGTTGPVFAGVKFRNCLTLQTFFCAMQERSVVCCSGRDHF